MRSAPGRVSFIVCPFLTSLAYDDIKDQAQEAIQSYHTRISRPTVPARSANYQIHSRPTYQKIPEDPEYLKCGGALKPFQLTGLNWLAYLWCKGGHGGMLADEVSMLLTYNTN